jgi:hypothetical protein
MMAASTEGFQYVGEGGWNTIKAEVVKSELYIDVYSTTCGTHDDSAGITMPRAKAKEFAEWLLASI